ncbi:Retrovirus-related Pol polyprotein from type-1 retrotransposable element R1 [Araneus ventricosus]|uniref:Retrovirus-related Pol polyprotein from type-1 retrotransposable element R1 n=1 Tax=Araneus ventricosus TaxID=182803 RepID=A0A4Y2TXV5_ARAVE|nr:Retrovirus-related Pol polyprotein from type-1 retrotransposable element R1 [Araneus ventricosus]
MNGFNFIDTNNLDEHIEINNTELKFRILDFPLTVDNIDFEVYTDGFGIDGNIGASVCIFDNSKLVNVFKFKLSDFNSVFQAELAAINFAAGWALDNNYKVNIFTDSLSSIEQKQCTGTNSLKPKETDGLTAARRSRRTNLLESTLIQPNKRQFQLNAVRKEDGSLTTTIEEALHELLRYHFPDDDHQDSPAQADIRRNCRIPPSSPDDPPFSPLEVKTAVAEIRSKKAPDPDGLYGDVIKAVFAINPNFLVDLFNCCLERGYFPKRWRTAQLVLFNKPKKDDMDPSAFRPIYDPPFSPLEVKTAVGEIRSKKAPGPDGLYGDVIKAAFAINPNYLVDLFNCCLERGYFPKIWRTAQLVLFNKPKKDDMDPSAFRPICLLDALGKVLDKLVTKRLYFHLLSHQHLHGMQFGFMPGKSATDAVLELKSWIHTARAEEKHSVIISLDIQSDFSRVWWPLVLHNLRQMDCPKNIFRMIASFLEDRSVSFSYSNEVSTKS